MFPNDSTARTNLLSKDIGKQKKEVDVAVSGASQRNWQVAFTTRFRPSKLIVSRKYKEVQKYRKYIRKCIVTEGCSRETSKRSHLPLDEVLKTSLKGWPNTPKLSRLMFGAMCGFANNPKILNIFWGTLPQSYRNQIREVMSREQNLRRRSHEPNSIDKMIYVYRLLVYFPLYGSAQFLRYSVTCHTSLRSVYSKNWKILIFDCVGHNRTHVNSGAWKWS